MEWIQLLSAHRVGEQKTPHRQSRSAFEQDFDRIIFSQSFRSLQDKTQVFPLAGQDFAHTRLTHSLEVSSVGRSLGREAGSSLLQKYPELKKEGVTSHDFGTIVAAAALAHDIGNPPFGHAGEAGISDFFNNHPVCDLIKARLSEAEWHDITNFEGNAQGFRLLNQNYKQGLRMTCATLGAFTKYPRAALIQNRTENRKSQKKYGFHQYNLARFQEMANELGLESYGGAGDLCWCRHPLAFLVEAADDVCYTIIDLEDGTNLGWLQFEESRDLLGDILKDNFKPEKLEKLNGLAEKTGSLRAMVINELINQLVVKFMEVEEEMLKGNFDQALTDLIPAAKELKAIQQISVDKIYRSRPVIERETAGFEVLRGLLEAFVPPVVQGFDGKKLSWNEQCMIRMLPKESQTEINTASTLYEKILFLMDFISGLTDSRALNLFRNIKGIALPGIR